MSDEVKYQRKKTSQGKDSGVVDREVRKLFESNADTISASDIKRLRNKYNDEALLEQIQFAFLEKRKEIKKRAKKFAKLMLEKYGDANYPLHIILKKSLKYKRQHNLSDAEFQEFRRIYEKHVMGLQHYERTAHVSVALPQTNLSKTLGHIPIDLSDGMSVSDKDYSTLQEILRLYSATRPTHAQIVLQSMVYKDTAYQAMVGQYKADKHNPACHIHPVIAALFLPKIKILDEHMLIANIAYIVHCRHNRKPIMTKPDYELFYDLITDPNDVVCDMKSPVADLKDRAVLQHHLWNSVLALRNGRYYDCNNMDFLMAVDNCKISNFDAPDFMYVNDEGTILRRLLAAFSFRPTIVTTTPLYGTLYGSPMAHTPVAPTVTSMPMVTLRLKYPSSSDNEAYRLEDSLEQAQWFLENGTIVPKNQSIIYSRDVIFFYIPRHTSSISIERLTEPYNFSKLPATISGFERINNRNVHFDEVMEIRGDKYQLRSVVVADVNVDVPDLIIGSSAVIISPADLKKGVMRESYYHYDPRSAAIGVKAPDGSWTRNAPITVIDGHINAGPEAPESFMQMAIARGTIFLYELISRQDDKYRHRIYY